MTENIELYRELRSSDCIPPLLFDVGLTNDNLGFAYRGLMLKDLPLRNLDLLQNYKFLTYLEISGTQSYTLSPILKLLYLTHINASNNMLPNILVLFSNSILSSTHDVILEREQLKLYMEQNNIDSDTFKSEQKKIITTRVVPHTFKIENDEIQTASNIIELNLSQNLINSIVGLQFFTNLRVLDLSNNLIQTLLVDNIDLPNPMTVEKNINQTQLARIKLQEEKNKDKPITEENTESNETTDVVDKSVKESSDIEEIDENNEVLPNESEISEVTELPPLQIYVKSLNISNNPLKNLAGIENFSNLKFITADNCNITKLWGPSEFNIFEPDSDIEPPPIEDIIEENENSTDEPNNEQESEESVEVSKEEETETVIEESETVIEETEPIIEEPSIPDPYTPKDPISIEELSLRSNALETLEGIEFFIQLVSLDISNNMINDLTPLSNISTLKRLWVEQNPCDTGIAEILARVPSLNEINGEFVTTSTQLEADEIRAELFKEPEIDEQTEDE